MELRKSKSFLAAAKELHFGKAAEKLNITQPAYNLDLKNLYNSIRQFFKPTA